MKTSIVYATRNGSTERCVQELRDRLSGETELFRISRAAFGPPREDLGVSDALILGGPIYGGTVLGAVSRFCERRREQILQLRVGVFVCCLESGERAQSQLDASFPPWLLAHAETTSLFGGMLSPDHLRPLDRFLSRRFGVHHDVDRVDRQAIDRFAQEMSRDL